MKRQWISGVLLALLVTVPAWAARPYRGGAVASAHPVASAAAVQMLDKGGNAVDAAVAAAFTLAVVGPYHSGLGGGGFALVHEAKAGRTHVLDFREVAPQGATREMYLKDGKVVPGLSTDGALSVAVPGAVAGYLELLEKHGKLPRAVVLAPAIAAARDGFWVTPKYQGMASMRRDCLKQDPEATRAFLVKSAQGEVEVPALGYLVRQPELARTLGAIARDGAKAFYGGLLGWEAEDTPAAGEAGTYTMLKAEGRRRRGLRPLGDGAGAARFGHPEPLALARQRRERRRDRRQGR